MKLRIKTYKSYKTKKYLKNFSFIFIFNTFTFKNSANFKQFNLNYHKLFNNATKTLLKKTNLKSFCQLPQCSTVLVWPKEKITFFSNNNLKLIGIKLNNKIYVFSQLNYLIRNSYWENITFKIKILNFFLKSLKTSK